MGNLHVQGFGAVSMDDILYVDRPLGAGKGRVSHRSEQHGGNVATALAAVAALGGKAGYIGWLNESENDSSVQDLHLHGVEIRDAPRRADARAIRSVVIVAPDGERFIAYDDVVPHGTSETLPDAVLTQAPVLLVDSYAIHAQAVVARAVGLGVTVVADIEWSAGTATDALMALVDHLVVPRAFAEAQAGSPDTAAILKALWSPRRAAVVVTDGGRGADLRQRGDGKWWHLPAHAVDTVDTTGAGDCFHGAYALAVAEGGSPLDCARQAAAAAALSTTGSGGRSALPGRTAVAALMARDDAPVPMPVALRDVS
jgi:sugar/nucleoside kinase (ribokinase family)